MRGLNGLVDIVCIGFAVYLISRSVFACMNLSVIYHTLEQRQQEVLTSAFRTGIGAAILASVYYF